MSLSRALVVAVLLAAPAAAVAAPPGFAFLEVPVGASASAMGGACVARTQGAEAAFWNPAGLARVEGTQVAGSHAEYLLGLKHDQFALAGQLFGGGIAASLRAEYSQPIDARDEIGNTIGSFGEHDLEFQLGYGRRANERLRYGVQATVLRERIDNSAAGTWTLGAGAQWDPALLHGITLGLAAQHLGPAAHFDIDGTQGAPVTLPASVQAGAAWSRGLAHGFRNLTLALDTRAARGRQAVVGAGAEVDADGGVALRLGLREGDDIARVTAGLGYRRGDFGIDYAWLPSRLDLGDTHRFSFSARF